MKTTKEIQEWLLENCVDGGGDLNLNDLDFSNFEGNVWIGNMKVKKDLWQHEQEVGGDLRQYSQTVNGTVSQYWQEVGGDLLQYGQKVKGFLNQGCQGNVEGYILQDSTGTNTAKLTTPLKSEQVETNPDWLVRVINEENALDAKIGRLIDYLNKQDNKDTDLVDQLITMLKYDKILKSRIYMAGKKGEK